MNLQCSCNCKEPHIIAVRTTCDEKQVAIWSDGMITHKCIGYRLIPGIGKARSKSGERLAIRASRWLLDQIWLHNYEDLGKVYSIVKQEFQKVHYPESLDREAFTSYLRDVIDQKIGYVAI